MLDFSGQGHSPKGKVLTTQAWELEFGSLEPCKKPDAIALRVETGRAWRLAGQPP